MKTASAICGLAFLLLLSGCDDTGNGNGTKAQLLLEIKDISFSQKDGRQVFNHTRVFREIKGVPLKITRGRVCVESRENCIDAFINYSMEAHGKLTQENHHVATRQGEDEITFEYWAKDENNNDLKIKKTLIVDGENATIKNRAAE